MNQKNTWLFILILLLQIINIIYWGFQKEGYFGDELYSYQFICQTDYPSINSNRPDQDYLNNWHSSEYYQDYFTISGEEAFDFAGVYNSIKSDVHPPLYYMFLLISCSLFKSFTKWSIITLNLCFFICSSIILYEISRKMITEKFAQLLPCLFWGFSVGAVTTALFGRMYMLLATVTLLFIYIHIILIDDIVNQKDVTNKLYVGLCITTILGTLTQYYFLIFAFFLCSCTWLLIFCLKKFKEIVKYTAVMIGGLVGSYGIWPTMYKQVFKGYRGDEAFANLKSGFEINRLRTFIGWISKELFAGKLKLVLIATLILSIMGIFIHLFQVGYSNDGTGKIRLIISKRNIPKIEIEISENVFAWLFVFFATVMNLIMIAKIAPYQSDRYILNIQAVIVMLFISFVIILCKWIGKNKVGIFVLLMMIFITILSYFVSGVGYLYKGVNEKLETANLYSDLPVILVTYKNARFTSCNEALYFQNGQMVYPIDENGICNIDDVLQEIDAAAFILYVDKSYDNVDDKLQAVKNNVGTDKSKWIYSTNVSAVYMIER